MRLPFSSVYAVRTDVLGDTTCFTGDNVGFADMVEQRGLTMVNVTHHGDDRRARDHYASGSSVSTCMSPAHQHRRTPP
jgi:hypothetical protein